MAKRNIIKIDPKKCNGCQKCVTACAERALAIVDGVVTLVKESYCDGLGACIGECPTGALTIVLQEAADFDEAAVAKHLPKPKHHSSSCPSAQEKTWEATSTSSKTAASPSKSALTHWPIKIDLLSSQSPVLQQAHLLICADCVPFVYANFHSDLLSGKALLIGCPKLNDAEAYLDKLKAIFKSCQIKQVTVVHMEVPCCYGLIRLVKEAATATGANFPIEEKIISIKGESRS